MHTDLIRQGYNRIAAVYARNRDQLKSTVYLHKFLQLLPPHARVLDLGCGAGVPVDTYLTRHGCLVTGLDISEQQIALAKKNCSRGEFIIRDMQTLKPGEFSVDAVVSFYAIFHLPRTSHQKYLNLIHSFLPPRGILLITMGDRDFEGTHDLYGAPMWSSHYGPVKNRSLVECAGFTILTDDLDQSGGETHQILLAQKAA